MATIDNSNEVRINILKFPPYKDSPVQVEPDTFDILNIDPSPCRNQENRFNCQNFTSSCWHISNGKTVMKPATLILFVLTPCLAGCGSADRAKIVGRWNVAQIDGLVEKVAGDSADPNRSAKMSVRFENSGRLSTETRIASIASTKSGSWKFLEFDSAAAIMRVQCTLSDQPTTHEIEFLDSSTIRWIPPNLAGTSQKLRYVRAVD